MKEIDNKKKSTKIIKLFYPLTFNNKGIIVIYSLYLYFFFLPNMHYEKHKYFIFFQPNKVLNSSDLKF